MMVCMNYFQVAEMFLFFSGRHINFPPLVFHAVRGDKAGSNNNVPMKESDVHTGPSIAFELFLEAFIKPIVGLVYNTSYAWLFCTFDKSLSRVAWLLPRLLRTWLRVHTPWVLQQNIKRIISVFQNHALPGQGPLSV